MESIYIKDLKTGSNYPRKAQAPYNKINKNSVITEFKNCTIIGWVLVALDAEVSRITARIKPNPPCSVVP
jgi:hypothetical protein